MTTSAEALGAVVPSCLGAPGALGSALGSKASPFLRGFARRVRRGGGGAARPALAPPAGTRRPRGNASVSSSRRWSGSAIPRSGRWRGADPLRVDRCAASSRRRPAAVASGVGNVGGRDILGDRTAGRRTAPGERPPRCRRHAAQRRPPRQHGSPSSNVPSSRGHAAPLSKRARLA